MNVLSQSIKRFVRQNLSWNNILFQWFIMGTVALVLASLSISQLDGVVAWLGFIFFGFIAASFYNDVIEEPLPGREQYATQKFNEFLYWWEKTTRRATIGEFQGKPVLEIWVTIDFRRIYDRDGYLIAFEQTTDWSMSDPDWRPGDLKEIEISTTTVTSGERLSWIARLRSPKLPEHNHAQVLDADNQIVGVTTFNER